MMFNYTKTSIFMTLYRFEKESGSFNSVPALKFKLEFTLNSQMPSYYNQCMKLSIS